MKTIAYICDCCNGLFLEEDVLMLQIEQPDLFENKFEYKSVNAELKKGRTNIHFCLGCFRVQVSDPCKGIDRAKQPDEYNFSYELYKRKFYERLHHRKLLRDHSVNR